MPRCPSVTVSSASGGGGWDFWMDLTKCLFCFQSVRGMYYLFSPFLARSRLMQPRTVPARRVAPTLPSTEQSRSFWHEAGVFARKSVCPRTCAETPFVQVFICWACTLAKHWVITLFMTRPPPPATPPHTLFLPHGLSRPSCPLLWPAVIGWF